MAYVGCIAGAIPIEDYRQGLIEAGFAHVEVIDTRLGPERLRQGREPGGLLPAPGAPASGLAVVDAGCCSWTGGGRGRGVARPAGRPAAAVRRERLRRQREGLRRQAGSRITFHEHNQRTDAKLTTAPASRDRGALETLATTLDTIAEPHHSAGRKLAAWIAASNGGRSIIVVCTGNSRRSLLGALMGQAAAAYLRAAPGAILQRRHGPSAFNPRTIAGPSGDWLRDRAHRRGGPAGRAEPSQSQVSHPVGGSGLGVRIDRVLQGV